MSRRSRRGIAVAVAALATLSVLHGCGGADASGEWRVERVSGPLGLAITYPTEPVLEGQAVTVLGTTGNASARVTLDGRAVFVASNGAFAAVAPAPTPGTTSHRLTATLGRRVEERAIPIVSLPRMPSVGADTARAVARDARVSHSVVADVHERGGPYERVYLFPGAAIRLDSSRADSVHAIVERGLTLWLAATAVAEPARRPTAATSAAHGPIVLTRGNSEQNVVAVRIALGTMPAIVVVRERSEGYAVRFPGVLHRPGARAEIALAPGIRVSANDSRDDVDVDVDDAARMVGYELARDGRDVMFRVRQMPGVRRALRVLIDPGHPPLGATGPTGINEAAVTLAIARQLQRALHDAGVIALLTRETMVPVSLGRRVALAASSEVDVVVSLHADASPDGVDPRQHTGPRTFFLHTAAAPLAAAVQQALVRRLNLPGRGVVRRSLAITDMGSAAAILCEVATLTDPEQEALLGRADFQAAAAQAIADGVLDYADHLEAKRTASVP